MGHQEIRRKTWLRKLELIIKERRLGLRWLGHVLRMEDSRIPREPTQWELKGYKRKPRDGHGNIGWTSSDEI